MEKGGTKAEKGYTGPMRGLYRCSIMPRKQAIETKLEQ